MSSLKKNRPPFGVHNLGNSCYLSCAIQSFFCMKKFVKFVKNFKFDQKNDENLEQNPQSLFSRISEFFGPLKKSEDPKNSVVLAFKEVFERLEKSALNPRKLMELLRNEKAGFYQENQEADFVECFQYFLDKFHQETQKKRKNHGQNDSAAPCLKIDENFDLEERAQEAWELFIAAEDSFVSRNFFGQNVHEFLCSNCEKKWAKFEFFNCFSLQLENRSDLEDLISNFYKAQNSQFQLDCEFCKTKQNVTKTVKPVRLPNVLIFQILRFKPLFEAGEYKLEKILHNVKFENLLEFSDSPLFKNLQYPDALCSDFELLAHVHHTGTTESGHYFCYAKSSKNEKFYKFDDHQVTHFDEENGKENQKTVYVLIYTLKNFS